MRARLLAMVAFGLSSAMAQACVTAAGGVIGNTLTNECPKTVWIAWCPGSCRPNGDTATRVEPGHFIPAGKGPIEYLYCVEPKRMESNGNCK